MIKDIKEMQKIDKLKFITIQTTNYNCKVQRLN